MVECVTAGDLPETLLVQRIQRDVDPRQSGGRKGRGEAGKEDAVRREREALQAISLERRKACDQIGQIAPEGRFATSQANLVYPETHEEA